MEKFKVEIITPSGLIYSGDVDSITLPGAEGEFGVLAGHAATVSLLTAGIIDIEVENGMVESVAIDSGYVQVSTTQVDVLAEGAVSLRGESDSDIAKAIKDAKDLLKGAETDLFMTTLEAKIESAAKAYI
jgi:F-type H+-transporting ATPase subunit epsilon